MGYNQNNAGIYPVPRRYGSAVRDSTEYDKYNEILSESNKQINISRDELFIENVRRCNFIILDSKKGHRKQCICGGILNYADNIELKYREDNTMKRLHMTGKKCVDCGRILVIRQFLLKAFYERR